MAQNEFKQWEVMLVRHAQTGGRGYNQLTSTGNQQAFELGEYLGRMGLQFDLQARGDLDRHAQTLEQIAAGYRKHSQIEFPRETITLTNLNEVELAVWFKLGAVLRKRDPDFARNFGSWSSAINKSRSDTDHLSLQDDQLAASTNTADNSAEQSAAAFELKSGIDNKVYKAIMLALFELWISRDPEISGIQTYDQFCETVLQSPQHLSRYMQVKPGAGETKRMLVISSGTPIALLLGWSMGQDSVQALDILKYIHNTSVSLFQVTAGTQGGNIRWQPIMLNALPHLHAPHLKTII